MGVFDLATTLRGYEIRARLRPTPHAAFAGVAPAVFSRDAVSLRLGGGHRARSNPSGYVERLGIRGDSFAALANQRRSITITSAMVDAVVATTTGIRDLGNTEGVNVNNLRFVHHHLIWVAKLLRPARFTSSAVSNRLLAEWAQLAAWMAMDAGQYGLSQRYVTSGLHATHEVARSTPAAVRALHDQLRATHAT